MRFWPNLSGGSRTQPQPFSSTHKIRHTRNFSGMQPCDPPRRPALVSRTPRRFERALLGRRAKYLLSTNAMDLEASRFDAAEHFGISSTTTAEGAPAMPVASYESDSVDGIGKHCSMDVTMSEKERRDSSTNSLDRQGSGDDRARSVQEFGMGSKRSR